MKRRLLSSYHNTKSILVRGEMPWPIRYYLAEFCKGMSKKKKKRSNKKKKWRPRTTSRPGAEAVFVRWILWWPMGRFRLTPRPRTPRPNIHWWRFGNVPFVIEPGESFGARPGGRPGGWLEIKWKFSCYWNRNGLKMANEIPQKPNIIFMPSEKNLRGLFFCSRPIIVDSHLRHFAFAGFLASGWFFLFEVTW